VKETDRGLWVKGRLDVEDNPVAAQVYRLMKRRSLKEFSFGYDVPAGGAKRAKDGATELHEIDPLVEIGPTLKGMNEATELHAVKSALEHQTGQDKQDELQEVKDRLAQLEQRFNDFQEKGAEGTGKGPEARPVDPLREVSRQAVAAIRLDGVPERKSPPIEPEQPPAPPSEAELREQFRDVTMQLLRGN
jgi:hypothetical protein